MQSQSRSRRAAVQNKTPAICCAGFFLVEWQYSSLVFCFLGARYTLGEIEIQNYLKSLNPPSHEKRNVSVCGSSTFYHSDCKGEMLLPFH